MQSKKRSRLVHIVVLVACAGFIAVALSGCGIAHGPYGRGSHGYGYHGAPNHSDGRYNSWGSGPTQYHDPSGMDRDPNYWGNR